MEQINWKTEQRKIKELMILDINPRKITEEKKQALTRSLEKFNLADIPVINNDNSIISGNQRVKILYELGKGDELIDVRIPSRKLSIQEVKQYMLIANTHAGVFDAELLEVEFQNINIEFDYLVEKETKTKTNIVGSTVEKVFFLHIKCKDENHCQELFDKLAKEGLEIKIIN